MANENDISINLPHKSSFIISPLSSTSKGSLASSISYVSYEAEEEPYNPRHLSCCDRLRLETDCHNMNFTVWTTLGRLEWADAFGRGSGGCGYNCCNKTPFCTRCCWCFQPFGPGTLRNFRVVLFIACTALNILSFLSWTSISILKFSHWLTLTTNLYFFCAMLLAMKLHNQDNVPVNISPLGQFTWFLHAFVFSPQVSIGLGYWLTHFLFAELGTTYADIIDHAIIPIVILIDFYFGAQPFISIHYFYSAILPTAWLIFSGIQYLLKFGPANPDGSYYIYPFVNWAYPETTGPIMIAIFAWVFFVHYFIWFVSRYRDVPYKHYESTLKL